MLLLNDNIGAPNPTLDVFIENFQREVAAFHGKPNLEIARTLSDAARDQMMRIFRISASDRNRLQSLFQEAADAVAGAFPEAADAEKPMPYQYATHLRRRVAALQALTIEE